MTVPSSPPTTGPITVRVDVGLEFFDKLPFKLDKRYQVKVGRIALLTAANPYGDESRYIANETIYRHPEMAEDVMVAEFREYVGFIKINVDANIAAISQGPGDLLRLEMRYDAQMLHPETAFGRMNQQDYSDTAMLSLFYGRIRQGLQGDITHYVDSHNLDLLPNPDPRPVADAIANFLSPVLDSQWGIRIEPLTIDYHRVEPQDLWDIVFEIRLAEDTYQNTFANQQQQPVPPFLNPIQLNADRNDPNKGIGQSLIEQAIVDPVVLQQAVNWMRSHSLNKSADCLEKLGPVRNTQDGNLAIRVIAEGLANPRLGIGTWVKEAAILADDYLKKQQIRSGWAP